MKWDFSVGVGGGSVPSAAAGSPRPRAAFVCAGDPEDARTWSGTPGHMLTHLREFFDVTTVVRQPWPKWFIKTRLLLTYATQGRVDLSWSPFWTALASRAARRTIVRSNVDFIFCVGISPIAALLSTTGRTVFISDATVAGMLGYNPTFTAMSSMYRASAMKIETNAVSQSLAAFYPSDWARDDAIRHHAADPRTARKIGWGSNLTDDDRQPALDAMPPEWRLLFVGVRWRTKGGDIALETVRQLNRLGIRVHLDVVGSAPADPNFNDPNVTLHGFLDKNDPIDRATLTQIFRRSHLLLFPTQFDALGVVSAEAASFGVPTVAFRTGGVPANVIDGETGVLLPAGTRADVWAKTVHDLIADRERYATMRRAALAFSRKTANWKSWAAAVADMLVPIPGGLIASDPSSTANAATRTAGVSRPCSAASRTSAGSPSATTSSPELLVGRRARSRHRLLAMNGSRP